MGRKMLGVLAALLTLMLAPGLAFAQLRRGDSGAQVMELQQMLLSTGWLFEEPDGVFGRRTEQAVRQYESHAGLKADGIADEAMLASLRSDYLLLTDGQPEDMTAQDTALPFCSHHTDPDGSSMTTYCPVHAALHARASALMADGSAQKARQACTLWRDEINRLYDAWLARTDESQPEAISRARSLFLSTADAQEQAIEGYYGTFQVNPGDAAPCAALELLLRDHTAWLCALITGALTGYDGPEL